MYPQKFLNKVKIVSILLFKVLSETVLMAICMNAG